MEAETYLSSGFPIRAALEATGSFVRLGELASIWMPSRLKGVQVDQGVGTPILSAGQVFEVRPRPRRWLALEKISDAKGRFVDQGMILVTRSGNVGRATIAYAAHEKVLISDDLLRVEPKEEAVRGWVYAYLLASETRAMATSVHYGHIIKHLEPPHLEALPVPTIPDGLCRELSAQTARIIDLRNRGSSLTTEAEAVFEAAVGLPAITDWGERGFTVSAARAFTRRRLDASYHNPGTAAMKVHLAKYGVGLTRIKDAGYDIWIPGRYKRIPAEGGVVYRDSADLLEVSPDLTKRFADCPFGDDFRGRVKSGWVLVSSSGQVYGIIGTAILATSALDGQVVSNHVIRLAPRADAAIRAGYLATALSHPSLGLPLVKALAFGSSVPEIDSGDLAELDVVRLDPAQEAKIAELAEASARAHAEADALERAVATTASTIIGRFTKGEPA